MGDSDIILIKGDEVLRLLDGREAEVLEAVRLAYETHASGDSALPHSTFLRFPNSDSNRIIGLPAYLGGSIQAAGMKWISSFPGNHEIGYDRASAVIILNSMKTGRPRAILEGSIISARRTAASAALAARYLHGEAGAKTVGLIGCGLINYETLRFLLTLWPGIERLYLFDSQPAAAQRMEQKARKLSDTIDVRITPNIQTVFSNSPVVSLATTATSPHIVDLSTAPLGSTILHISLRDFAPGVILSYENVVDDVDHVCRAQTSIHLTEQVVGNRDFIRCTLGDILLGRAAARNSPEDTVIFSPFGLGIIDLAVSNLVCELARDRGIGTLIESFLPEGWMSRA